MTMEQTLFLCMGFLVISFLYSSVGHAGASGYIAVMSLTGLAPEFIRPAALLLNILVAGIAFGQFYKAGHFEWQTFWPYAVLSIPCSFLGGSMNLPVPAFNILIGVVLLFSASILLITLRAADDPHAPACPVSMCVGGGLGFLAGITGTGGGIFLTPTLILLKWAKTRTASATSALFILVNSISGFLGLLIHSHNLPIGKDILPLGATVLIGGSIGSYLGSRKLSREIIKGFLAFVLLLAAVKLIFL